MESESPSLMKLKAAALANGAMEAGGGRVADVMGVSSVLVPGSSNGEGGSAVVADALGTLCG